MEIFWTPIKDIVWDSFTSCFDVYYWMFHQDYIKSAKFHQPQCCTRLPVSVFTFCGGGRPRSIPSNYLVLSLFLIGNASSKHSVVHAGLSQDSNNSRNYLFSLSIPLYGQFWTQNDQDLYNRSVFKVATFDLKKWEKHKGFLKCIKGNFVWRIFIYFYF